MFSNIEITIKSNDDDADSNLRCLYTLYLTSILYVDDVNYHSSFPFSHIAFGMVWRRRTR